ncbi:MAG: MaoC/PaaZ C-terminal domain-containing protein [Syntrophomonas sp.]
MKSYYLEDFAAGQKYRSVGRTVTESDIAWFAGLSGDLLPVAINSEVAKQSDFGGRIAQGMLGSSILFGLWVRLGFMELNGIALLESDWKYLLPIRPGDTIHAECEVTRVKLSSKPHRGTVFLDIDGVNQLNEVVQEGHIVFLMKARGLY